MREHIQNTIKNNNDQYLEKTKPQAILEEPIIAVDVAESSTPIRLTDILTDQTIALKRSKRLKEKKTHMIKNKWISKNN